MRIRDFGGISATSRFLHIMYATQISHANSAMPPMSVAAIAMLVHSEYCFSDHAVAHMLHDIISMAIIVKAELPMVFNLFVISVYFLSCLILYDIVCR